MMSGARAGIPTEAAWLQRVCLSIEYFSLPLTPASRLRGHLASQSWGLVFGALISCRTHTMSFIFLYAIYIFIYFLFLKISFRCGQAEVGARQLHCQ